MSLITLLNAHIAFGERPLLDEAQLTVQARERLGLIGRNGTGKSTLVCSQVRPRSMTASVNHLNLKQALS
jgi:ATPase subunit of ABC transporter with duplicated ATPase domains